MAVYTDVSDEDLDLLLTEYNLGEALSCKGIAEGVENSNFLLHAEKGHFILTLYEKRMNKADLPFFLGLMEHLASNGFVSPRPIASKTGKTITEAAGRPAAIIEFLEGRSVKRIVPEHCTLLGESLAKLHLAASDFSIKRPNALSIESWRPLFNSSLSGQDQGHIKESELQEIDIELSFLEKNWPTNLPEGVIHADLFPDNIFFLKEKVSGVIDYYFACNDFLAYDIAICLNAWCFESDASFNITKARKLINGYRSVRAITDLELEALPLLCRGAALRFYLTRLYDWINQVEGALVKPKNPLEYLKKLRFLKDVKTISAYGID
ncbi:MAG: homoserine kinase [Sneathiella sp.]|nr:homoserine kinase [Sneathiella sp.]